MSNLRAEYKETAEESQDSIILLFCKFSKIGSNSSLFSAYVGHMTVIERYLLS